MALVMLPSDLPWWDSVKKQLKKIEVSRNTMEIVQSMQKIYEICNVSLDPEDDTVDPEQFVGFLNFLDNEMSCDERSNFLNKTLPNIVKRALMIKELRPRRGLHFSLQQQSDSNEVDYNFAASLLANAFFSTFPKRTDKSHPTLQNFNFATFFKNLQSNNAQKAKLRSILHYFDWLEKGENSNGKIRVLRQVMRSKEWLTIDDWLECSLELCPLHIKHDGKLDRSEPNNLQICFTSNKIGGNVLGTGCTQESISLVTMPELLTLLLNVEALEDNEVVTVERVRHIARIPDPKHKAAFEKLDNAREVNICCIDADDYTKLPIGQYEEDNILRELNKCLLAFQQKKLSSEEDQNTSNTTTFTYSQRHRRLSPIGESIGSNQSDGPNPNTPLITQQSCSTTRTDSLVSENSGNNNTMNKLQVRLEIEKGFQKRGQVNNENLINNRRGRFIVLGSSGECLPVTRYPAKPPRSASTSSSSEDDFHSAKSSLDDESDDDNYHKRYSIDLETPERRHSFAQRLREALKKEEAAELSASSSNESSYAVGISVAGSGVADCDIKVKRGGSTGFALREDSLDEEFLQNSLHKERQWIDKFRTKQTALSKKESNKSSDYSFSTEYSSEMEEVYEQFSHWLENPILETEKGCKKELEARDLAVVRFAGSLLKRTLSESFAGVPVPLTEGCDSTHEEVTNFGTKKNKIVLNAKSLSLELARQKHRLAAQLVSAISSTKSTSGLRSVTTGNWGCGSSRKGDVQLKVVIQWMAASVAGVPSLVYYTHKHQQLAKLDTVCRILIDRKWTVKDLADATLRYSNHVLRGKELSGTVDMVRTYVRKTQKGAGFSYSREDLQKALDDVQNGNKTTRGAAIHYNIPRSTLKHYVRGTRGKGNVSNDSSGGGGVKSYLSSTDEEEIASCIRVMEKNGFGLSREDVLDLVHAYIRQNNFQTRFKEQRPGTDWFIAFRKRHRLSIKKPQSIEHVRCDQVNPGVIYDFYDKLSQVINALNLQERPSQIFNCDETSFCHDPSKTKIVGAIGAKCQRKTSSTGRENTSVLLCCSADGKTLPLLCVFKGKYVMENWVDQEVSTQTAVSVTERGWMETTLFYNWFRDVFLPNIGTNRPVLLVYDGHVTHISTKLIQLAQENDVTIMKLPPHTTHVLQPLDVAIFKGLKSKWDKELCKWQRENPRKKIPKPEFTAILSKVVGEIQTSSIINGFKATGVYDLEKRGPNRDAIPISIFKPDDLNRYRKKLLPVTVENEIEALASTSHNPESQNNDDNPQPSTSKATSTIIEQAEDTEHSSQIKSDKTTKKCFEDVLLDMFKKDTKKSPDRKRRRLVTHCEIITTSEYLKKKQEEEEKRQQNLEQKKAKHIEKAAKKQTDKNNLKNDKKKSIDSSSDSESNYSLHESDDSLTLNFSNSDEEVSVNILPSCETWHVGDYAVLKVFGKDNVSFRMYVGRIQTIDANGFGVKFLKRHAQTMKFKETEEESYVKKTDVVRKLSRPLSNKSARYKDMVHFNTDLTDLGNLID